MLKKFYCWFHRKTSKPAERGEYSAGYWQEKVRDVVFSLRASLEGNVLEVGCGEGLFLSKLAQSNSELKVFGIDIWREIIFKAKKRLQDSNIKNSSLIQSDSRYIPFRDEFFDAVICINVLYNLPSEESVYASLRETMRVCKSKGKIIFDIRNNKNPLLYFKFKLAKCYDKTAEGLPLRTDRLDKVTSFLETHYFKIVNIIGVGFPKNSFAPIIIIEAKKE